MTFLLQNDRSNFPHAHFGLNPPSTVNTAKFDCLDLSGPPCRLIHAQGSNCKIPLKFMKYLEN